MVDVTFGFLAHLDVAVAGLGSGGADAEGQQGVMGLDEVEAVGDGLLEEGVVCDEVVAGGDDDARFGVDCRDVVCRPGDAGGCVAAGGLQEDVCLRQLGELLADEGGVLGVGDHHHVLGPYDGQDAVVTHLEERAAGAEEVEKLFRFRFAAVRPEAAADAATHYDAISVWVNHDVSIALG